MWPRAELRVGDLRVELMSVTGRGWTAMAVGRDRQSLDGDEQMVVATALGFEPCGHRAEWWTAGGPVCRVCDADPLPGAPHEGGQPG